GASSPGPVGIGGAPQGGSACGSAGGGGPGPSGSGTATPQQAGGFGPVAGAIVRIYRQGSSEPLTPFTSRTDANGYYYVPFIPAGEPFTVRAFDPATGRIATANGVGRPAGKSLLLPLVYGLPDSGPGAPTASFTVTELPSEGLDGAWNYRFDATASSDEDGEVVSYLWSFGGHVVEGGQERAIVDK